MRAIPGTGLSCTCGKVRLMAQGRPILSAECHCNSCREAGARLDAMPGARKVLAGNGGTPFVLYRKDRVDVRQGSEQLKAFRLKPDSPTRRIIATCCNTPIFLEFKGGHWMSLYADLWPAEAKPAIEMRTMTGDLSDPAVLDDSVPNCKNHSVAFFAKLMGAWIAMGFRSPKVEVNEELEFEPLPKQPNQC